MSFLRHTEIYRSDMFIALTPGVSAASRWSAPGPGKKTRRKERALIHRFDEFPVGYSLTGCSPAEPASASPTTVSLIPSLIRPQRKSVQWYLCNNRLSQPRGSVHPSYAIVLGAKIV